MFDFMPDETDDLDRYLMERSRKTNLELDNNLIGNRDLNRAFNHVINKLGRFYSINKASLAIFNAESERFRVTHLKQNGSLKKGLTLKFASRNTTMYQVLKQGYPVADNFPEQISNSVIEKRILLGAGTSAVLIIPLIYDNLRIGVLNLASCQPAAFGLFLDGVGEGLVMEFMRSLHQILQEASIKVQA